MRRPCGRKMSEDCDGSFPGAVCRECCAAARALESAAKWLAKEARQCRTLMASGRAKSNLNGIDGRAIGYEDGAAEFRRRARALRGKGGR